MFYAYALADGTRQDGTGGTADREFATHSDNDSGAGVWSDGTTIWVVQGNQGNVGHPRGQLYAYALADGTRQDGTGSTTNLEFDLHSDNDYPCCMWSDGTTIWVAETGEGKLYAYALADGTRQDGTGGTTNLEFDLYRDNDDPCCAHQMWGMWSDGTTIWVAQIGVRAKLFAYALADGTRQDGTGSTTNLEFDLHSDNSFPIGLWSDGTTIWVADYTDKKLYAYALPGAPTPQPPTPAALSALGISPGALSPSFSPGAYAYTASAGNAVTSVTVTAPR